MERASQCLHSEVRDGQKTERKKENRMKRDQGELFCAH